MLITNLTGQGKFYFDPELLEECLHQGEYLRGIVETYLFSMKDYVEQEISPIPFYYNNSDCTTLIDVIKEIPIYLVSKNEFLKTFKVGYLGHTEEVFVPVDCYKNLVPKDMSKWTVEGKNQKRLDPYDGKFNSQDMDYYSMVDNFACYIRTYPRGRSYTIEESHPKIFLWVDKLMDYIDDDGRFYEPLATQIILHEIVHAIMDINIIWDEHPEKLKKLPEPFYTIKEESLATALSLSLMKLHLYQNQWEWLLEEINKQPAQYKLGLDYMYEEGMIVDFSIDSWRRLKSGLKLSMDVANTWIKYIQGPRPLDVREIVEFNRGIYSPAGLFQYKSKFYDSSDVCVRVIKDYAAQHHDISSEELHEAFPDNINSVFNPLIDYPEETEFHYKSGALATTPIRKNNLVECCDGLVAICAIWFPHDMPVFVRNAKRLGIDIKTFS